MTNLFAKNCLRLYLLVILTIPGKYFALLPSSRKVMSNSNEVAQEDSKNLASWAGRWEKNHIGFHREDVNPAIGDHVDKLLFKQGEDANSCANVRTFVPLCGKSVDMAFLASKCAEVVGVEGIRKAFEDFAKEQPHLNVSCKGEENGFERWEGDKITLLKGDFFELDDTKTNGKFGAIYDRASLVAIEPEMRGKYLEVYSKLIAPGGRILLATLERRGTEEAMKRGPPFSIPESMARELFEQQDWVESMSILSEADQLELRPQDRERYSGLDQLLEVVYLIQAK